MSPLLIYYCLSQTPLGVKASVCFASIVALVENRSLSSSEFCSWIKKKKKVFSRDCLKGPGIWRSYWYVDQTSTTRIQRTTWTHINWSLLNPERVLDSLTPHSLLRKVLCDQEPINIFSWSGAQLTYKCITLAFSVFCLLLALGPPFCFFCNEIPRKTGELVSGFNKFRL